MSICNTETYRNTQKHTLVTLLLRHPYLLMCDVVVKLENFNSSKSFSNQLGTADTAFTHLLKTQHHSLDSNVHLHFTLAGQLFL